ncbi:MAG TPA: tRNA pseudouridine(38-40) synthase TruA [Bacteroidales bacterium]|nr:tRNA pseudouridine(38-40) synthase TruA [Bacteroidales bacterium]
MRYFLEISYLGTHYCGWQRQPNGISVQQLIEEALTTLLRSTTSIVGAGRTDAGVHGEVMIAHFDTASGINIAGVIRGLNSLLPPDIAVHDIRRVTDEAHARFSALNRRYRYTIVQRKDPMRLLTAARIEYRLDITAMNQAAEALLRHTDMTSFSKLHTDVKTNDCHVTEARWQHSDEHTLTFHITANRFLRNMVRAVVGTLLDVGRGKITVQDFENIIIARERGRAGTSAPAQGLALIDITYPDNIYL